MQTQTVEKYIKDHSKKALGVASSILGREISLSSFNGIIGGKNTIYSIDALNYVTPEEYIEAWKGSHQDNFENDIDFSYKKSSHRIDNLLQDPYMKEFIENYLARTYFRKHAK